MLLGGDSPEKRCIVKFQRTVLNLLVLQSLVFEDDYFLFITYFDGKIAVAIAAQSGFRPSPKSNAIWFPLSYGN